MTNLLSVCVIWKYELKVRIDFRNSIMSIFKSKIWWSNETEYEGAIGEGSQCEYHLRVDKIGLNSDSDCIIVAEGYSIKIYKPAGEHQTTSLVLEARLNAYIVQIETGKFISGSEERQVIVLHPNSYSIYSLHTKEGETEAGNQNTLNTIIKHSIAVRTHSVICGNFGNTKTRELICIQSMDGSLIFYDQDIFLFSCPITDVIVPGPFSYIKSCDSFAISKSTWILEIYSYQQLKDMSESIRQNKKVTPQWYYNAGEEISFMQVIQTSNNFSSIIVIGERYIYCFQDNGLMKFMKKLDYAPTCFCAYLVGWYYEPGARLLLMVASEDSKLYIYENTLLLWSCELNHTPIAISRCFLKGLHGGIVALSTTGILSVNYLGTEPDLTTNNATMINEPMDSEKIQAELNLVEDSLNKILDCENDAERGTVYDLLKFKIDVGKPTQNHYREATADDEETSYIMLMCPILITLTLHEPKLVKNVQITYVCHSPVSCSDTNICLDQPNGTEILETEFFVSNSADISNIYIAAILTVTDSIGKVLVATKNVLLPLTLFCSPCEPSGSYDIKIDIQANIDEANLLDMFAEFNKDEFLNKGSTDECINFIYRSNEKTVRITLFGQYCRVESKDFPEMTPVVEHLINKLNNNATKIPHKNNIRLEKEFCTQIIHNFLKCIEAHANIRIQIKEREDELSILHKQFTLIQKRLLVQYGSLPPGDCEPLEFLMKDTYKKLTTIVNDIIQSKEALNRAGNRLQAVGRLIVLLMEVNELDQFKLKLVKDMLSLDSFYEDYQEWEEAIAQSISYIHNNIFKKSEKDKEKLAPLTEQGILSHVNLKRLLKQIKLILDQMFSEVLISYKGEIVEATGTKTIMRIEELVEVI